jgi:hypothetical protein
MILTTSRVERNSNSNSNNNIKGDPKGRRGEVPCSNRWFASGPRYCDPPTPNVECGPRHGPVPMIMSMELSWPISRAVMSMPVVRALLDCEIWVIRAFSIAASNVSATPFPSRTISSGTLFHITPKSLFYISYSFQHAIDSVIHLFCTVCCFILNSVGYILG